MKYLLIILLALPTLANAQQKDDYVKVMDSFVAYYNTDSIDKICSLFTTNPQGKKCFWRIANHSDTKNKYGAITSYEYVTIIEEGELALFKVVFSTLGVKAISFGLEKDNTFGTFRFDTSSDEINQLLDNSE